VQLKGASLAFLIRSGYKHFSLFWRSITDVEKFFKALAAAVSATKHFLSAPTFQGNKLECFFQARLFSA